MIRLAAPADIPAIIALFQSEPGFWNSAWDSATIERALETAGGLTYVWEQDGQILAFICAHDLGFRAYLSELIVAPTLRGQGIARQMLEAVQDELARRGRKVLIADVWQDAVGFYESMGWSEPPVRLMRKKL